MGPERSMRGAALNDYSIQVGIGRALSGRFAEEWVGQSVKAKRLLPPERIYPVPRAIAGALDIDE
ncbi:hypothetical protein ACH347_02310 [Saccharopolyspora sp. 5N102]|uniref:hypothetical protein n=1 Tax=Saccharopolyspora sp. 5N102 TaxID=3375155 RepID=UPI0037B52E65